MKSCRHWEYHGGTTRGRPISEVENDGLMRIRKHGTMNVDAMIVSSPEHMAKSSDSSQFHNW